MTQPPQLAEFCRDLRLLRERAGGPSVRRLAERVGLGKTQISAILGGGIRRPPDWHVVRGIVEAVHKHAHDNGRGQEPALRAGIEEYWRPRHAMVEHALSRSRPRRTVQPSPTLVPQQLPPAAPHFAGRLAQLAALSAGTGGPLLITGMAGVGKTTLAVAWAHRVAGRFPDGQLYLNLRGFDPSGPPMTPEQAVRVLLEALSPAPRPLPPGFEAQVGLYRSRLAGKRILVVLDNARDAEQIRALLPAAPGCRAVVTSRVELTGLIATDGAYPVRLDAMPDDEARELLANRLGRARIEAEAHATDRLIAACGGLPLALAVVAARAASRPDFALSALADEAGLACCTLSVFGVGDPGADARAIFSGSYRALTAPAARLFRLFGVVSSPGIGLPAAASLAGVPEVEAATALTELCRAHLVTEITPGRYGMHDLMRAYATELACEGGDDNGPARRRYLGHLVHTACAAAMLLSPKRAPIELDPLPDKVSLPALHDRGEAMRWFTAEHEALFAAARVADDAAVWRLAWAVADFCELQGRFNDWAAVQRLAIAAADRIGDAELHGRMLLLGGNTLRHTGDLDGALLRYEQSRKVFARNGNLAWQARAEHGIGSILERQGRHEEALARTRQALETYRASGDLAGQARARNSLAWRLSLLGRHEEAITECLPALAYYEEAGDTRSAASTWDTLGHAHHGMGRHAPALECYREALRGYRASGDRYNEACTLTYLGDTHLGGGEKAAAAQAWLRAWEILDDLEHPDAEPLRRRLQG